MLPFVFQMDPGLPVRVSFYLFVFFYAKRCSNTSSSSRTSIGNELVFDTVRDKFDLDAVKLLCLVTDELVVCYCHSINYVLFTETARRPECEKLGQAYIRSQSNLVYFIVGY